MDERNVGWIDPSLRSSIRPIKLIVINLSFGSDRFGTACVARQSDAVRVNPSSSFADEGQSFQNDSQATWSADEKILDNDSGGDDSTG